MFIHKSGLESNIVIYLEKFHEHIDITIRFNQQNGNIPNIKLYDVSKYVRYICPIKQYRFSDLAVQKNQTFGLLGPLVHL